MQTTSHRGEGNQPHTTNPQAEWSGQETTPKLIKPTKEARLANSMYWSPGYLQGTHSGLSRKAWRRLWREVQGYSAVLHGLTAGPEPDS